MKVKFSKLAVLKLENLTAYLSEKWSESSKDRFLLRLNAKIESIQFNPELYPASVFDPDLRKCVVTKQTVILYEIQDDFIFILNLIDTRQNPRKIKREIKKYFP